MSTADILSTVPNTTPKDDVDNIILTLIDDPYLDVLVIESLPRPMDLWIRSADAVRDLLRFNTRLTCLHIDGTQTSSLSSNAPAISPLIETLDTSYVVYLNIISVPFTSFAPALHRVIKQTRILEAVSLSNCGIKDEHVPLLLECLDGNESVCALELFDNLITDVSLFAKMNNIVTILDFYNNPVNVSSVETLLKETTSLKNLSLFHLLDPNVDFLPIAKGLETNTTVQHLHLGENIVHGLRHLERVLVMNTTLLELDVSGDIPVERSIKKLESIARALETNTTLTYLSGMTDWDYRPRKAMYVCGQIAKRLSENENRTYQKSLRLFDLLFDVYTADREAVRVEG